MAAAIASLPPALWFGIFSLGIGVFAYVLTFLQVVIFGIPSFVLLSRYNRANYWTLGMAGLLWGIIPCAILAWPVHPSWGGSSYTADAWGQSRLLMVDGYPTAAGWLSYAQSIAYTGVLGLICALLFLLSWKGLGNDGLNEQ